MPTKQFEQHVMCLFALRKCSHSVHFGLLSQGQSQQMAYEEIRSASNVRRFLERGHEERPSEYSQSSVCRLEPTNVRRLQRRYASRKSRYSDCRFLSPCPQKDTRCPA